MIASRRLVSVAIALVVVAAASACDVRMRIEGQAMEPALKAGGGATVTRRFDSISRGDIVAHKYPNDHSRNFVKRIIGLPGEEISSTDGVIFVNGQRLDEPYVLDSNRSVDSWGPTKIKPGEYFVMGDKRNNSSDSRMWGTVRQELIWGKVRQ
jgi:signal peptidase I